MTFVLKYDIIKQVMEKIKSFENRKSISEIFEDSAPRVVEKFTPSNFEEAKAEFFDNPNLDKPNNFYEKLNQNEVDGLYEKLSLAAKTIFEDENLGEIERELFEIQIETRTKTAAMLQAAVDFREATNPSEKSRAEFIFMKNNIEVESEPEKSTFESLLGEKLAKIKIAEFDETGEKLRAELFELLDEDYSKSASERFQPKQETVETFGDLVRDFYAHQLNFIPEKPTGEKYSAQEIFEIFGKITSDLEQNSGFSHFDIQWKKSGAIHVKNADRMIEIPENRAPVSRAKLEGLVVHEIGTHYYRAQIGENYGISPLQLGLDGYLDTEEGVARAMEMSMAGKFEEAGVPHYLTAGLAYFEGKNFREVFETNWRLYALEKSKNSEITDEEIVKAKSLAYQNTQRIFRGTDELPWFKDLSYFNGAQKIWKYIEENIDSPTLFDELLLGGKNNLFNRKHQKAIYELKVGKR